MNALCNQGSSDPPRFGLMAGWGRYPLVVAEGLRRNGFQVYTLGVREHADPAIAALSHDFEWIGMGKAGRAIRYFRQHGIERITMAGKIHKFKLFQPWGWFRHLPDWRAIRCFYPHFVSMRKDRKDDTLMIALVEEFAKDGVHFVPATDYVPELLVNFGNLTRRKPSRRETKDIEFGWRLAKQMGGLDVGQSVAVRGCAAIAVEAIEGTDECIRRAGRLVRNAPFTVVKVAKPRQDMRFDVPAIGVGTLESIIASGARCLAIEAGKTIVVDQADVVELANRRGVAIVAIDAGEVPEALTDPSAEDARAA